MASPQALLICLLVLAVTEGWDQEAAIPGCHLHPFNVTVRSDRQGTCQGSHVAQACVGHCESSAFPSRYSVLAASGYRHNITSVSQCCTISSLKKVRGAGEVETEEVGSKVARRVQNVAGSPPPQVKVQLQCVGDRRRELEIFTARACQCDMCRLSRF
uniref:Glycoprotein hormone subunit alpha 2 n=1 Tax=Ictidomys tridecemlineatus TaxID=43179 RepID=A0A287DFR6_ICTTR